MCALPSRETWPLFHWRAVSSRECAPFWKDQTYKQQMHVVRNFALVCSYVLLFMLCIVWQSVWCDCFHATTGRADESKPPNYTQGINMAGWYVGMNK